MPEYTLNFEVSGGEISSAEKHITADSVEFVTAAFSFDEGWSSLLKTAVFRKGELVYHVPVENDVCTVPFEVLKDGIMYVSVFGISGNTRATTDEVALTVEKSGYIPSVPTEPTPDPYNYFLEKVTQLKNESAQAADECENSAAQAKMAEANAGAYCENALVSAHGAEANRADSATFAALTEENSKKVQNWAANAETNANAAVQAAATAKECAESAKKITMDEIEAHNIDTNVLAHPNIMEIANEAKSIALGKANSLVFETKEQLINWVSGSFERSDGKTPADLKVGDNLYIIQVGVPDYWWDGATIQPLGAETPFLADYYTKDEINGYLGNALFAVMSREEYDVKYQNNTLDAGRIYFVYEGAEQ